MIRAIDPSAERFLAAMDRIHARAERAQREISSGLRVSAPSDDPGHLSELLALHSRLDQTVQVRMNLGRVKAEVDTAEQSLQEAIKGLERVVQLGVEGVTGTQPPEMRRSIAVEVQSIHEHLVAIAATRVEGRYIFSGDTDWVQPYTVDLAQPNGVSAYAGSASTRETTHPAGYRFGFARPAQEIFDNPDPDRNVFAAVNALRLALENGPTVPKDDPAYQAQYAAQTAAIDAALVSLRRAQDHLNLELSFYGAVQNRVTEAIGFAHTMEVREQNQLSAIRDADLTASILELNLVRTHQDAALEARAQMPRTSLFDFLG